MIFFGTLFNINYLDRGLALYESLSNTVDSFKLFILCMDSQTFKYFEEHDLANIIPIRLTDVEKRYPELLDAKGDRSTVEYFFTLSPILPLYILDNFSTVQQITTLDADIFFFSDPTPIFEEMGEDSILITPHKFLKHLQKLEKFGLYNVSFQSFKRDDVAMKCLLRWKEQCIEWCHDRLENNKFADQKYLDTWVEDYGKVSVLEHSGTGLAPWNADNCDYSLENDEIRVNGQCLIFYHFQGLKFLNEKYLLHGFAYYYSFPNSFLIKHLYEPYILILKKYNHSSEQTKNIRVSITNKEILRLKYLGAMLVFRNKDQTVRHLNSYANRTYLWIRKIVKSKTWPKLLT